MVFFDLTHPQRADLSGCAVTDGNHPIRFKALKIMLRLALQAGCRVTALFEASQSQWMHRLNRRTTRAGGLQHAGTTLRGDGLTQNAPAAVMGANKQ